jgi:lactate permease
LIAGLVSLISIVTFVQFWKPKYRPEFQATFTTTKPSAAHDEENADNNSSLNEKTNSGKYQTEESSPKASISERENVDSIENNNGVGEDTGKGGLQKLDVERLTLRQTMLAWSPWVIIVVVVIM